MKFRILVSAITAVMLVINQFFAYPVFAEEYEVSGNGEGSSSQVNIQENKSNEVHQENNAEVKNDVEAKAESGDNETNDNSGDKNEIKTGEAATETVVTNSGNTNEAEIGCCPTDNSAKIVDNGSGTDNQINANQNSTTNVSQDNKAKITNNISVNANTGDNEASGNNGDVNITTGNVKVTAGIINKDINSSYVSGSGGKPGFNLKISGNGEGSTNNIEANSDFKENFLVNNYLELTNDIHHKANTGDNKAKGNNGKVSITTGSVLLDLLILNKGNNSKVITDCDCKPVSPTTSPTPTPSPSGSPSPSSPPSGGNNGGENGGNNGGGSGGGSSGGGSGSSSGSSGSSSGGQVLGATLPATGGFSVLSLTLVALSLLILGIILRLDYAKAKSYFQYFNFSVAAPVVIYILAFCKSLSLSRQADFARRRAFYFYPQDRGYRPAY